MLKNKKRGKMKTKEVNNYDMNSYVYKLRRQVINLIYEAKNFGVKLPRINVRIGTATKGNENMLGLAQMQGAKNIWITDKAYKSTDYLRHVVFHEIGHTVFKLDHNEKCPLMSHKLSKPCSKEEALKILKAYAN